MIPYCTISYYLSRAPLKKSDKLDSLVYIKDLCKNVHFFANWKKKPKASIKWLKEPSERGGTVARTDGSL